MNRGIPDVIMYTWKLSPFKVDIPISINPEVTHM